MRLLVTGASGFLGKYVVSAALRRGHQIKAIIRPNKELSELSWSNHPNVQIIQLDLENTEGLVEALLDVDGVIHLAASKSGDFQTQYAGTVVTTENLLKAMNQAQVKRLIAISTFSVYDYLQIPQGAMLNEDSPLEKNPQQRDVYAQTKLIQEERYHQFAQKDQGKVTIIRPGMVYGRDYLWNACLGNPISENLWLRIGSNAIIPLIYVENCAEAIVIAAEKEEADQTINLVDDHLPTQQVYVEKLQQKIEKTPGSILIPWPIMLSIANICWSLNQNLLKGKAKLPGILIPSRLHARFKHLNYSNERAKEILHWQPLYSLDTALKRSCSNIDLLTVI